MSLDWDISRIKDYKTKCWIDDPDDPDGGRKLNPKTDILIWATMAVDLRDITEKNLDEWERRIELLRLLDKPLGTDYTGDRPVGYYPDRKVLEDHIGLGTNVATKTYKQWTRTVFSRLLTDVDHAVNRNRRKREKENAESTAA